MASHQSDEEFIRICRQDGNTLWIDDKLKFLDKSNWKRIILHLPSKTRVYNANYDWKQKFNFLSSGDWLKRIISNYPPTIIRTIWLWLNSFTYVDQIKKKQSTYVVLSKKFCSIFSGLLAGQHTLDCINFSTPEYLRQFTEMILSWFCHAYHPACFALGESVNFLTTGALHNSTKSIIQLRELSSPQ